MNSIKMGIIKNFDVEEADFLKDVVLSNRPARAIENMKEWLADEDNDEMMNHFLEDVLEKIESLSLEEYDSLFNELFDYEKVLE